MSIYKKIYSLLLLLCALHGTGAPTATAAAHTANLIAIAPVKPIRMPLEVMGPDGITETVSVSLPSGSPAVTLWIQAYGLTYDGKASVRVGSGPWATLSNASTTVAQPGKSYGGIGGAFGTIKLTLPIPQGPVTGGRSVPVAFRFNGTDGTSIGFRILKFNLLAADGTPLLPSSTFYQDDPKNWTPPFTDAANILAGKALWKSAPLVQSDMAGAPGIQATCADCHTQDGSDLKYFNFSNYSIIQRARFHGLTHTQARQVASYIRTLSVPNPGRPWNPPFQPGPGLDSKPASEWAAGAGLDAVLDKDAQMLPYLFPSGINKAAVATSGTLNMRELPVALQLLDWNRWLPTIHPKDVWGANFTNSAFHNLYTTLRAALSVPDNSLFISFGGGLTADLGFWDVGKRDFIGSLQPAGTATTWTPDLARAYYSASQWQLVKTWELMQEFNLNDKVSVILAGQGPGAEPRSWLNFATFTTSPFMTGVPEVDGLLTKDRLQYEYLSNAWYYTGIVVNSGNRHRGSSSPVDWGYVSGRVGDFDRQSQVPETLRLTAILVKGMQQSDSGGLDPFRGWNPLWSGDIADLVDQPSFAPTLNEAFSSNAAQATQLRTQVLQAMTQAWFDKTPQFTPQQYYAAGLTTPGEQPGPHNLMSRTYYVLIPGMRAAGVDGTLLNSIADWGKTMWPAQNWDALKQ